jgi:hypothetical protein
MRSSRFYTPVGNDMRSQCQGHGCTAAHLIRAHLTPQSFARWVQGDSGPNILVSPSRYTKRLPHGLFDPDILCETCDGFLNTQYDDPAFELLKTIDLRLSELPAPIAADAYFEHRGANCTLLCGFVLSILWRYSISRLPDTSHVNLGPYQGRAREVLWGAKTLADFPEFQVICQRYAPGPVETRKMYSSPVDMRGPEFFSYGFSIIGFHFIAKVDRRPFPPIYTPFVLKEDVLRGYYVKFGETPQGRGARDMLKAARARRAARSRG